MVEPLERRTFLKFGAALPIALRALQAGAGTQEGLPPRRIIFICNSLGFFRSYFSPTEPGQLESSRYLRTIECPEDVTVFENMYHHNQLLSCQQKFLYMFLLLKRVLALYLH